MPLFMPCFLSAMRPKRMRLRRKTAARRKSNRIRKCRNCLFVPVVSCHNSCHNSCHYRDIEMKVVQEGSGITIKKERTGRSPPRDEATGSFLDMGDDKRNPLCKFWKDVFCSRSVIFTFSFALLFQIGKIRP